jgi:hypothetical protein
LTGRITEDVSYARRTTALLRIAGTGSAALALGVAATGTSLAAAGHGGSGWSGHTAGFSSSHAQPATAGAGGDCRISTSSSLVPTASGTVQITVTSSGQASCDISLASYLTEGATWATSGTQTLVDVAHATVQRGQSAKLSVKVPDVGCFGQIDLYKGSKVFSGNNAPHYPNGVFSGDSGLIKAWNGGTKVCSAAPVTSTSASASPTPSDSATTSASPSASVSPSASASSTSSSPASAAAATSSASGTGGGLAETGSSGTATVAGIGGALVIAGGVAVFVLRRRPGAAHR